MSVTNHYETAEQVFRDEIEALQIALKRIKPSFNVAVEKILASRGKVVLIGLGKSGLVARKISATFSSTGTSAVFLNAGEALHGDVGVVSEGDVAILVSNSGTTVELVKMVPVLRQLKATLIGVLGKTNTALAQNMDIVLDVSVDREACPLGLAPMSSSTVALVVGDALAAALMKAKNFTTDQFALFHPSGQLGRNLLLTTADLMHKGDQLPKLGLQATFKEVVSEMTRFNLGAICICDEKNRLLGLITDGDVRRAIAKDDAFAQKAEQIMTKQPSSVRPDMRLAEVLAIMEGPKRQIYVVPVVDEKGICLGLVRMHDILKPS
jgi:arabinose-5-phosphate isomerase